MIRLSATGWLMKKCWLTETMCPEIYISAASTWSQGHDLQRICTASVMLRNWNLVWQEGKIIVYEFRSFCMGNTSAKTIPPKQEELRLRSIDIRMKPRVKDRLWYTKNSKNHGIESTNTTKCLPRNRKRPLSTKNSTPTYYYYQKSIKSTEWGRCFLSQEIWY